MSSRPSFWKLACVEPFRIFFPLGTLVGLSGVSLWPLFFTGIHTSFYPGVMHARLMIEGFLGGFVFGFLGTALPRITGTAPLSRWELGTLLTLYAATVGTHIAERPVAGDLFFLLLLATFLVLLGRRFAQRTDLPPPGFVLVALGFLNAFAGALLVVLGALLLRPDFSMSGVALLHQGWVLHLILGIGGFLLPRFLGLPPRETPESRTPPPGWKPRAFLALGVGGIITTTLAVEPWFPRPGALAAVRCVAAAIYLGATVPWVRASVPNVTLTIALRAALALLLAGLIFPLCWPLQRVAGLHVVFLGGFSLMTFTVATRVVLGHSGFSHIFPTRLLFVASTAALIIAAMVLRTIGDFLPLTRAHWLNGASYLWMLASALWAWRVLPKVRIADPEE
jgi:uncharacterized protein involved in response to NO